ncbi:MAG: ATPase [Oscillospiraceae bacterium]|nr:ATPase [Oscillospiraceae bacterium]MBR0451854.1 ATPase [Oscillospiraceae bacterium]MDO5137766.1 ATPase [Oscillospiraceae bacterium]
MAIDKYLDKLDDMLDSAVALPLAGGKKMIDADKMRDLLDTIRLNLPQEIKDAKAVVSDRNQILEDAKAEAEDIITRAENRARQLISEQEVTKAAQQSANDLIAETQRKTKEMERATLEYSENALKKSEDALLMVFNEVKSTRLALRGKVK